MRHRVRPSLTLALLVVLAFHMTDVTNEPRYLSDRMLNAPLARVDHLISPLLPSKGLAIAPVEWAIKPTDLIDQLSSNGGHSRNLRNIPKSRDFH